MTNMEMAKKNFERGLWTEDMLKRLVENNKLSAADFKAITGKAYK